VNIPAHLLICKHDTQSRLLLHRLFTPCFDSGNLGTAMMRTSALHRAPIDSSKLLKQRPVGRTVPVRPSVPLSLPSTPTWVSKRETPSDANRRRILALSATAAGDAEPQSGSSGLARGFWTFVGILSMLGSVGGALVSLLGLFNTPYTLALPLVLPVVSLFASLQREGLIAAVGNSMLA
jgi:hypothetical protein